MYKRIIIIIAIPIIIIAIMYIYSYDKKVTDENSIDTDNSLINVIYNQENNVFLDDILGNLHIEKIGLNAGIKEGSTSNVLQNYIGHIANTPIYDGNVCLAAHNRGNTYSYFARLNELEKNDEVKYESRYGIKTYKVSNISTILETDWELLKDTNENKITMITCIKNRPNQRLCVQAIEIK